MDTVSMEAVYETPQVPVKKVLVLLRAFQF